MKKNRVLIILGIGFMFLCGKVSATEVIGATPGNGGDSVETTFHFDANNANFQMTRSDGTSLTTGDFPLAYGSAVQIFNDGNDWVTKKGLQVLGADLSGANWSNAAFPVQGTVSIDPSLGRFKFASSSWNRMGFINSTIGSLNANPAQMVIHSDGSAICVYSQTQGVNERIYARHYYPATGWQSAVIIDSVVAVPTHNAAQPEIAMDASGRAICVFLQASPTTIYQPHANVFLPGTGWQGATPIDAGLTNHAEDPKVALANGKAICVYQQQDASGNDRIYATEYTPATGWYGAVTIDADDSFDNRYPQIAMNESGKAFCVYRRMDSPERVHVNEYLPGIGWQGIIPIDPGTVPALPADLAINNAGFAVCLMVLVAPGPQVFLYAIENAPGVGWTSPVELASTTILPFGGAAVSLNQAGQGLAAYCLSDGANDRIYTRAYATGAGWSSATLIDAGPGQDASLPKIVLNDQGKAMCAFIQSDGTNDRIYANHLAFGQGWSGVRVLDHGFGYDTDNVGIAINSDGEAFCVWRQFDGVQYRVDVSRFQNEVPAGTMQVRYYYDETPTISLPTENVLTIANRKIEPLQGGKVSIQLALAQAGKTSIKIYTLQGRLVKTLSNEYLAAGSYTFDWAALNNGGDLIASGVYIIRVQAPGVDETQKVVVIK